ncbi:MAG: hypothetical protein HY906_01465, partial [Deltaproteobacteria bacterium]|nr:hypothetical protein [Deltaproteobacteria bacterium]
ETNTQTTAAHCGGCGQACSNNNIPTATCTAGNCTGTCAAGFDDCNANKRTDGCEINTQTTAAHCGGCGQACSNNNIATPTCTGGNCTGTCNAGWGDCNLNKRTDGCEVNTNITPAHCGGCGQNCSNNHITTPTCAAGSCNGTCDSGWGDCDLNKLTNGCETNTQTTPAHCGACGQYCSNNHIATPTCAGGSCNGTCDTNWGDCDLNKLTNGCETDLQNTAANCGICGTNCNSPLPPNTASAVCTSGSCQVSVCNGGWYNQDSTYANGCECALDAVGNTCATATSLGAVAVDGTQSVSVNNLAGPGPDEDWYSVTFTSGATCNWGPRIILASAVATVYMRVYTNCSGGTYACTDAGNSGAVPLRDWQEVHQGTCGDLQPLVDPTPASGSFITIPSTAYIRVYTTASQTSCMPYTLTITN